MGFCIPLLSILSKIYVAIFTFFIKIFSGVEGITAVLIAMVVSSIILYLYTKFLGKTGGLVLMAVGIAGAAFSAGTTLALTVLGFVLTFVSKEAKIIVGLNILVFIVYLLCYSI